MSARLEWLKRNAAPRAIQAARSREGTMWSLPGDDEEIFAAVVMCDPTFQGAYVGWLLKTLARDGLRSEDLPRAMETLALFHAMKHRLPMEMRDIGRYASETDLHAAIADAPAVQGFVEIPDDIRQASSILYEGPEGCVAVPLDLKASKWWGRGTRWCTMQEANFDSYSGRGPLYVVVGSDGTKHQAHGPSGQFCDSQDRPLTLDRLLQWIDERPWVAHADELRPVLWKLMVRSPRASRLGRPEDAAASASFLRFMSLLEPAQVRQGFVDATGESAYAMRALLCRAGSYGNHPFRRQPSSDTLPEVPDGTMVDVAPLHLALDPAVRENLAWRALKSHDVGRFLVGVSEEPSPSPDVRIFEVVTEEAARVWSAAHPEYPAEDMARAFRSGSPLHVLVGTGALAFDIAVASLALASTPDTGLTRLNGFLEELDQPRDGVPYVERLGKADRVRARELVSRFLDIEFLTRWDDERSTYGGDIHPSLKAAVDRIASEEMELVASDPSGWSVRVTRTPFAATVLRMQAPASYGPPEDQASLFKIHNALFADPRRHFMAGWNEGADPRSLPRPVGDGAVVEITDPDGTRWLLDRGRIWGRKTFSAPTLLPMVPAPGAPEAVISQLLKSDQEEYASRPRDWRGLPAPCDPERFLEARPWLSGTPAVRMAMALVAGLGGFRETASALAGKPASLHASTVVRSDPLSVLCGTFGFPAPAVREQALDNSRWGRIVLGDQPLEIVDDGVPAVIRPSRQGDGWKAFTFDAVPARAMKGILRPAEHDRFWRADPCPAIPQLTDPTEYGKLRLYGELLLSVRSGATFINVSNYIGMRAFHLTPGLDDIGHLQRIDHECFSGGVARRLGLRMLARSLDPEEIQRHPFLHLREGGLSADDIAHFHRHATDTGPENERLVGAHALSHALLGILMRLPDPPLGMIREAMRQWPCILLEVPCPPPVLVEAAADDLVSCLTGPGRSGRTLVEEHYGTSVQEALGRFVADYRMAADGVHDTRFDRLILDYIQDSRLRDFISMFAPWNSLSLMDALERRRPTAEEPEGPAFPI
jgi:hypothetical protein